MSVIDTAVGAMISANTLLLMLDYDGTLVPIVSDPSAAVPPRETLELLAGLSQLANIRVAVVSGRSLADLEAFLPVDTVTLIGGHGAETESEEGPAQAEEELLRRLAESLCKIAQSVPGAMVEVKPTSVALHVRNATHPSAGALIEAAANGPGSWEGVRCVHGKEVIDLVITDADKGQAVAQLKSTSPEALAVYIGDDVTDEDAFAALGPHDLGIKVGNGPTAASFTVDGPDSVIGILAEVLAGRSAAGQQLVDRGEVVDQDGGANSE